MTLFEQIQKEFKGVEGYIQNRITFDYEYGNNDDNISSYIDFINIDNDYLEGYTYSESSAGCYTNEFRTKLSIFLIENKDLYKDLVEELNKVKNGYERY